MSSAVVKHRHKRYKRILELQWHPILTRGPDKRHRVSTHMISPLVHKWHILPLAKESSHYAERLYTLWERWDDGVVSDDEMWYSITPETSAKFVGDYIPRRVSQFYKKECANVLELFGGIGGNTRYFLESSFVKLVGTVEIVPKHIEMMRHNLAIYTAKRPLFICQDVAELTQMPELLEMYDCLFASPPWGGVGYDRNNYDATQLVISGRSLPSLIEDFAAHIPQQVWMLPKSTTPASLHILEAAYNRGRRRRDASYEPLETIVQNVYEDGFFKMLNVLFGEAFQSE